MNVSRRDALRASAGLLVSGLAGCTAPGRVGAPTDGELVADGFEDGMDEWQTAASIGAGQPSDPPLSEFEWAIERSKAQAADGEWSVEIFTEGDHDDGTAWIVREVDPPSDAGGFDVSCAAWSQSESFNTLRNLVMYLGPKRPADESSFPDPGTSSSDVEDAPYGGLREPLHLAEGWREYAFSWEPESVPDTLYLAVGVSVVWETAATHYVDEVRVETRA